MRWEQVGEEVRLTVEPGEGVRLEDVVRAADSARYRDLDLASVAAVLADGQPRSVARGAEEQPAGEVRATVADDGMSAVIHVRPPGASTAPLTAEDCAAALERAGVVLGVDHLLLSSIPLDQPGDFTVAAGWPPVPGRDGHVEYVVPATHEVRPRARRDGGVDFRAVATIAGVRAGQLLAVLVPPAEGTPGRTVQGETLPAPAGVSAELPEGTNVTVSEDGLRLYAAIDGLLEVTASQVSVRPDLVVPGDVDFETGSIAFVGDVIVHGSVRPGFQVRAGGRVVVMGDVEQADVEGGELVSVQGAVVGAQAVVRARGMIKVRLVREARLEAHGSVFIEREAQDATVLAGANVVLEAPRSRLFGGTVRAGREVTVGELGSVAELPTRVVVGIDPFRAEEIDTLETERAEHARTLERVATAVVPFREHRATLAALPEHRRGAVEKLFAVEASLRSRVAEVEQRLADLQPDDDGSNPQVTVRQALRPGVSVQVRQATLRTRGTQFRVAAVMGGGGVEIVPLGPRTLPRTPATAATP